MGSLRVKLLFLTLLTTSLVLAGCNSTAKKYNAGNGRENLLDSGATMQTADPADDPVAAHLAARAQVDPSDLSTHHAYTTTPTAEEVQQQTAMRIVPSENPSRQPSGFKTLNPSISRSSERVVQVANAPAVADTMPGPEHVAPASGNATSDVTGVRVGEHPDKTRFVLDLNAPGKFSYDLDPSGTRLTVLLPQSGWSAAARKTLGGSAMIKSYNAGPAQAGGVTLQIELKKPGRLTMSSALPPNEVHGNRIVFDVAPL